MIGRPDAPKAVPNLLDRLVAYFSPESGLRRRAARHALVATASYYEAAGPSRLRRSAGRAGAAPEVITQLSAAALREEARSLERNHDIARGILRTMVNNIVGPSGIGVEPQPRRKSDGTIHEEYQQALVKAYRDWCVRPEVTRRRSYSSVQRIACRTWLRDGEVMAQVLAGNVPTLTHSTPVLLSLELLEPDLFPLEWDSADQGIRQSIERNGWGQARAYWAYKQHPGERTFSATISAQQMRRIPAERMRHVTAGDRIGVLRGISEFASVLTRLADIKDYEESERIAAKVAASMTAFIRKGAPELFSPETVEHDADGRVKPRELALSPGMIFDDLRVGEDVGLIDSNRPNPNVITFRSGQLRAAAAGVGASYSSIARDYNGTYSAQRQELVEQWVNYAVLCDEFVGQFVQPNWQDFVFMADATGTVPIPRDVAPDTADDALFIAQAMPWINPMHEAQAWVLLVKAGFASEVEAIRRRGGSPHDVLEQIASFRRAAQDKGLVLASDQANDIQPPAVAAAPRPTGGSATAATTRRKPKTGTGVPT